MPRYTCMSWGLPSDMSDTALPSNTAIAAAAAAMSASMTPSAASAVSSSTSAPPSPLPSLPPAIPAPALSLSGTNSYSQTECHYASETCRQLPPCQVFTSCPPADLPKPLARRARSGSPALSFSSACTLPSPPSPYSYQPSLPPHPRRADSALPVLNSHKNTQQHQRHQLDPRLHVSFYDPSSLPQSASHPNPKHQQEQLSFPSKPRQSVRARARALSFLELDPRKANPKFQATNPDRIENTPRHNPADPFPPFPVDRSERTETRLDSRVDSRPESRTKCRADSAVNPKSDHAKSKLNLRKSRSVSTRLDEHVKKLFSRTLRKQRS